MRIHNKAENSKEKRRQYMLKYSRAYYTKNKNKWLKYNKDSNYYQSNREKVADTSKKYYIKNRGKILLRHKKYYINNTDRFRVLVRTRTRERKREDILFHLSSILRSRLYSALKNNQKLGSAVKDLGCTIEELKIYLENNFQPGMTWNNWGRFGWHIDHILPLISFNLSNPEQVRIACNYTNLRPLWWIDNLKKRKKDIAYAYKETV